MIAEITMGDRGFAIEGRVKWNSEIKEFKKGTDRGKLFTFVIYDESSDISILAANDVCDKWFKEIEPGQCYGISRLTSKAANPQCNKTSHECELQITKVSISGFARQNRNPFPTIHPEKRIPLLNRSQA